MFEKMMLKIERLHKEFRNLFHKILLQW